MNSIEQFLAAKTYAVAVAVAVAVAGASARIQKYGYKVFKALLAFDVRGIPRNAWYANSCEERKASFEPSAGSRPSSRQRQWSQLNLNSGFAEPLDDFRVDIVQASECQMPA